ncbi:MAG TPA: hypothetical protein VFK44_11880 [Bacillales bacterium]|nr:hypothetical protein [Bacillales bacterium]
MKESGTAGKVVKPLMVVFVVLIIAAASLSAYFMWNGTDVVNWGKRLPVVSYFFAGSKEPEEQTLSSAQSLATKQKERIDGLQQKLAAKQEEINQLKSEVERLEAKSEQKEPTSTTDAASKSKGFDEVSKIYGDMAPDDAASIISEMKNSDAVQVLSRMKPDALALILAEMKPKRAAKLTLLLANES